MKTNAVFIIAVLMLTNVPGYAQPDWSVDNPIPARQVHLDFHTSEFLPYIGARFDKEQWQEALKVGHVNQINIFAKGHHSWSYYPTKVGKMHPNLKFDLLGAQIEASHEIGVVCPIYFTAGWSSNDAEDHPEWCMRKKDGAYLAGNWDFNADIDDRRPNYSWKRLCLASGGGYDKLMKSQIEEICENYPVDGFWVDIYSGAKFGCWCQTCLARMKREGVDIADEQAVIRSTVLATKKQMREIRELVAKHHSKATVYFNGITHIYDDQSFYNRLFDNNTQQELEDLPTAWGGYDKLPYESKYHKSQGSRVVAMSGKFHKAWGEFGGFKHPDAIKYEAAAMISFGAACNFGDQLHPSGEMDMDTYKNIGYAFEYVEKIEEYGDNGMPASNLGLWLTVDRNADLGAVNMLLEMHYDFVLADETNLQDLSVLIIPGVRCLTNAQAAKINQWVDNGGKLIVFGDGALGKGSKDFVLDVGAEFIERSPYHFDFTVIKSEIGEGLVQSPFLNYKAGLRVKPTDAKVLANIREPYFNRTYRHYTSHRETPYKLEESGYPAVLRKGNVIYFAHNLDRLYYSDAVRLHRDIVHNAIKLLHDENMMEVTNLPSCGRVSFLKQQESERYVAHLLYSPALSRGSVAVLEDFPPIPNVKLRIQVPEKVTKVYGIPGKKKLKWKRDGEHINIDVPTFSTHTGIVFEY
jgi:hypothetical protein